jgi:hypothetical protein
VTYLAGVGADAATGSVTPEEELDQWLAARDWQLGMAGEGDVAQLASLAAREHAARLVTQAREDAAGLPEPAFSAAYASLGGDPLLLSQQFGVPVLAVMRRIVARPGAAEGLVICDGAGALIFRKPTAGFRPPRIGAACAIWPLFSALSRPAQPITTEIVLAGRRGERFAVHAWAEARHPGGFTGPEVRQAGMLLTPMLPGAAPALRVGASCRICPEAACPARREASILG